MGATFNIYEAKTHFSRLVARVESGEEITLSRNGRPVARLVPIAAPPTERTPGAWRRQVTISPDFDEFRLVGGATGSCWQAG